MKLGRLLIFAGEETGLPPGRRRKRFVKLVHNFLRFSEVNGLTTHAILKKRQKAVIDVNVFSSDFTHEGYKFFRRAYNKWSKAIEEGALDPDETDFLAAILANPRAKAPVLSERRPGKSRVKTTGRQATSVRGKRNKSKLANTFDDEYELAGPHGDIGAEFALDLHRFFRAEKKERAIEVGTEFDPVRFDLANGREAEDLETAAISEDWERPIDEIVQATCRANDVHPGTNI